MADGWVIIPAPSGTSTWLSLKKLYPPTLTPKDEPNYTAGHYTKRNYPILAAGRDVRAVCGSA